MRISCVSIVHFTVLMLYNAIIVYSQEWLKKCRELLVSAVTSVQTRMKGKGKVEMFIAVYTF